MGAPEMHPDLYQEHMTGDAAYNKAFAALADCPSFAEVERALKAYAHDLAEQQRIQMRAPGRSYDASRWNRCVDMTADSIDPEVSDHAPQEETAAE